MERHAACEVQLNSELLFEDPSLRYVVVVILAKAIHAAAGHRVHWEEIGPDRYRLQMPREAFVEATKVICPGVLREQYVAVFECRS